MAVCNPDIDWYIRYIVYRVSFHFTTANSAGTEMSGAITAGAEMSPRRNGQRRDGGVNGTAEMSCSDFTVELTVYCLDESEQICQQQGRVASCRKLR